MGQADPDGGRGRLSGAGFLAAGGLLWLAVVAAGMGVVWSYSNSAGTPADPPRQWPAQPGLAQDPAGPTLVMLAHPRCPCTRASLGELDRIMSRADGPVTAHVIFHKPGGFAEGWESTDLWRSAERIAGVSVHRDDDGNLVRRFGAATSGQVLVYGSDGRLGFNGGITAARGHAGDNVGSTLVRQLIAGGSAAESGTSVYGCPILGADCPDCCTDGGCIR